MFRLVNWEWTDHISLLLEGYPSLKPMMSYGCVFYSTKRRRNGDLHQEILYSPQKKWDNWGLQTANDCRIWGKTSASTSKNEDDKLSDDWEARDAMFTGVEWFDLYSCCQNQQTKWSFPRAGTVAVILQVAASSTHYGKQSILWIVEDIWILNGFSIKDANG